MLTWKGFRFELHSALGGASDAVGLLVSCLVTHSRALTVRPLPCVVEQKVLDVFSELVSTYSSSVASSVVPLVHFCLEVLRTDALQVRIYIYHIVSLKGPCVFSVIQTRRVLQLPMPRRRDFVTYNACLCSHKICSLCCACLPRNTEHDA